VKIHVYHLTNRGCIADTHITILFAFGMIPETCVMALQWSRKQRAAQFPFRAMGPDEILQLAENWFDPVPIIART
jgi:hypothetical protein